MQEPRRRLGPRSLLWPGLLGPRRAPSCILARVLRLLKHARRPATLLATAAVAAVPLAACGSSKPQTGTVSPTSYIGQLCTSTASWLQGIEARSSTIESELTAAHVTPQNGKRILETLVSTAVSDTESVVTALRTAGVPEVKNGKHISEVVVTSFEGIGSRLAGLQSQIAAMPTDNPAAFQHAAKGIREEVREAPLRLGIGVAGVNSPELEKAASESAVCKSVGARAKSS